MGDEYGRYRVRVHSALTGALLQEPGGHLDRVYGLSWARDDSFLVSCSADFTAKVRFDIQIRFKNIQMCVACWLGLRVLTAVDVKRAAYRRAALYASQWFIR